MAQAMADVTIGSDWEITDSLRTKRVPRVKHCLFLKYALCEHALDARRINFYVTHARRCLTHVPVHALSKESIRFFRRSKLAATFHVKNFGADAPR